MKRTLLIVALAAGAALIFAAVAASTLDVAFTRDFNLRLVQGLICPAGQTLEYRELGLTTYTDSDGTHNQMQISISCLAADGTRVEGRGDATFGALLGLYFLVGFIPLVIAGLVLRFRLTRRSPGRTAGRTS